MVSAQKVGIMLFVLNCRLEEVNDLKGQPSAGLNNPHETLHHICPCVFPECNCHDKAEECYFNQTVADLSLSLDIHGQRRGGGVCVGCRDNTAGINCQTCVPGFYRPSGVRVAQLCLIPESQ